LAHPDPRGPHAHVGRRRRQISIELPWPAAALADGFVPLESDRRHCRIRLHRSRTLVISVPFRPRRPASQVGPGVRIRFPPAGSRVRTRFPGSGLAPTHRTPRRPRAAARAAASSVASGMPSSRRQIAAIIAIRCRSGAKRGSAARAHAVNSRTAP
jgi:hypothetical protein